MITQLVTRTARARIPTPQGDFWLHHYINQQDGKEHLALVLGELAASPEVLARVHSECFTGDVLGSLRCDCGEQLHKAMHLIALAGRGVILYLRQEGRGIGLGKKLQAYNLQDQGYDTVDANLQLGHQADEREYSSAAAILNDLGVRSVRLLTNNPDKLERLRALGITVTGREALESTVTAHNAAYLATKVQRMRHLLDLPTATNGHPTNEPELPAALRARFQHFQQQADHHYAQTGRPFVMLTYAQSLDGSIAAQPGQSLRLSSATSLRMTHILRTQHDAILVGIGTVLADDPRLTVRLAEGADPQPVVVDSHLRLPVTAKILNHPKAPWIATTSSAAQRPRPWAQPPVRLLPLPTNAAGQVDLSAMLGQLGALGIRRLMVEGGAQIITSFLREQLAHALVITIAPQFVGGIHAVQQRIQLSPVLDPYTTTLGPDTIIVGSMLRKG